MARTPYLGLRGHALTRFMIGSVVCPAYMLLGYNNAVFGGLVNLTSFLKTFPRIDTVSTDGAKEAENARIQGMLLRSKLLKDVLMISRDCRGPIYRRLHAWSSMLLQTR